MLLENSLLTSRSVVVRADGHAFGGFEAVRDRLDLSKQLMMLRTSRGMDVEKQASRILTLDRVLCRRLRLWGN